MTLTDIWRIDNLVLGLVVCGMFAVQTWRMRAELDQRRKVLCAVLVLFFLRDAEGLVENLIQGNPGGPRLLFTTVLYLIVVWAVVLGMPGVRAKES